jgi:thiol:disulfide interchange protein
MPERRSPGSTVKRPPFQRELAGRQASRLEARDRSMTASDEQRHGGCRSFLVGGCLLAFAACVLAFVAVLAVIFALGWIVRLIWSLL